MLGLPIARYCTGHSNAFLTRAFGRGGEPRQGVADPGVLRLGLARTIASETDALLLRDTPPTVLGLDIPVESDPAKPPLAQPSQVSKFDVYMRLGISPRGKPEVLSVGRLPTRAPATVACLGT